MCVRGKSHNFAEEKADVHVRKDDVGSEARPECFQPAAVAYEN